MTAWNHKISSYFLSFSPLFFIYNETAKYIFFFLKIWIYTWSRLTQNAAVWWCKELFPSSFNSYLKYRKSIAFFVSQPLSSSSSFFTFICFFTLHVAIYNEDCGESKKWFWKIFLSLLSCTSIYKLMYTLKNWFIDWIIV